MAELDEVPLFISMRVPDLQPLVNYLCTKRRDRLASDIVSPNIHVMLGYICTSLAS